MAAEPDKEDASSPLVQTPSSTSYAAPTGGHAPLFQPPAPDAVGDASALLEGKVRAVQLRFIFWGKGAGSQDGCEGSCRGKGIARPTYHCCAPTLHPINLATQGPWKLSLPRVDARHSVQGLEGLGSRSPCPCPARPRAMPPTLPTHSPRFAGPFAEPCVWVMETDNDLFVYRSKEDLVGYHQNPFLDAETRQFLVKAAVTFGRATYQCSPLQTKTYRGKKLVTFTIDEMKDYGPATVVKLGSPNESEMEELFRLVTDRINATQRVRRGGGGAR